MALSVPSEWPKIPGFRIERVLGAGGMGRVYLAHQVSLDRPVALKLLPSRLAANREFVERFLREARAAGKLNHENIVAAFDVGESSGQYYFVMEYVPGETLSAVIAREGRLPEKRALELAAQVARGLGHAHAQGFIHRDIKPSNILVTPQAVAKICDLGLVQEAAQESEGSGGALRVTPAYASPEQCRNLPTVDHRADLYSLGVTLFEMLTGQRPFTAGSGKELIRLQVSAEPPAAKGLEPSLSLPACAIVRRLLEKDPNDRYPDSSALGTALEEALKPPPAPRSLPKLRAAERPPRLGPRVRGLPVLGGAVVLILLAVALFVGRSHEPRPSQQARATLPPQGFQEVFDQAVAFEEASRSNPGTYEAVRGRWKELESKFGTGSEGAQVRERQAGFDKLVTEEGSRQAKKALGEAQALILQDRPFDALSKLKAFPEGLAATPAAKGLVDRRDAIERQLKDQFRDGIQSAEDLAASGRFPEARGELKRLRLLLPAEGRGPAEDLAASYRQQIDGRFRNMDLQESRAMAEKRPEPVAEKPKPREASATDAPTRGPAAPRSAEPVPAVRTGPLGVFANALREGSAGTWAAAAAIINSHRGDSPLTRAADLFLSRGVSAWNLSDPERTTLIDAMSAHPDGPAEPTPVSCQASLDILAQGIAVPSGKSSPALTLFGCAELESLLAMERPVDAALLTRLGLRKSGVLGLWGPGARADRTDMARRLTLPDAGPVGRDPKRGPLPAEFADRYLSALLDLRQGVDVATVDVWRKLSGVAPDAAWAKMLGMAGERLHLALTCEICAGQGKSPCTACLGSGIASCTVCNGAGSTVDDCGGKVTCTACKGRGQALCTACQGGKTAVCPACNGKKTRAPASGALFRYLAELGLCEACKGDGSLFARVLYPCPKCDGLGRVMGEVPREMAKLPTWLKGASGATCWNALRWLAIHQNEDGSWASASWTARCTDPVCEAAPAGEYPVGVTSLALLAFLCAGVNPGTDFKWAGRIPAGQVVKKAVAWLVAHAGSGDIVQQDTDHSTLEHLLATLALALALSGSGSGEGTEADRAKHRETAVQAVKQTMALQGREGGWSARKGSPIDTWTTVWGAVALLAARDAGLDVPRGNLNRVLSWFTLVTDAGDLHLKLRPDQTDKLDYPGTEEFLDHPTLSASGAWLRIILEGKQTPSTQAAERLLLRDLPSDDPPARDFAWWFWGGEYLSQRATRGIPWTVWNGSLMKALLPLSETKWTCAFGSVAPSDRWGPIGGTVYSTAMGALALEAVLGQRPLVRIR